MLNLLHNVIKYKLQSDLRTAVVEIQVRNWLAISLKIGHFVH